MVRKLKISVLFFILLFLTDLLNGQSIIGRSYTLTSTKSQVEDSIFMGGYLDGFITHTKVGSNLDNDSTVIRAFEPMKSIVLKNNGRSRIRNPRLVLNGKGNWYDLNSLAKEAIGNASSEKEKLLSIWKFVNNNRVHYTSPNMDAYDSFKMLTTYGYGTCELTSRNLHLILSQLGYTSYSLNMPNHSVTGVEFEGKNIILDSDLEVFYLNRDNRLFASEDEMLNDKYLISRTKHFGRDADYKKSLDLWISRIYNSTYRIYDSFKSSSVSAFELNMRLRPGESLVYDYAKAKYFCHLGPDSTSIPENFLTNFIANGSFVYSTDFLNAPLTDLVDGYLHTGIRNADNPHLYAQGDSGIIKIIFDSPFPILNSRLVGKFFKSSVNDSIEIFYSSDDQSYTKIYSMTGSGSLLDSINLNKHFNYTIYNQKLPVTYRYFLKFRFIQSDPDNLVGLDSLYVKNDFQVSRFFLPELKIGKNIIHLTDTCLGSEQNLEVTFNWNESFSNSPPDPILAPDFPKNYSVIDSLNFEFKWPEAIDPDGDRIIDYEFILSDSPDLNFPLSPNFNLFTGSIGESQLNRIIIKEPGWLKHDSTYYWKVRAKDQNGAWSKWSPPWSVKTKGPMPPENCSATIFHDSIRLTWNANIGGIRPYSYNIYASDISNGFYIEKKYLIANTTDTNAIILLSENKAPKSFYRVTSLTEDMQESYPSDVVTIPNTVFYGEIDSIRPYSQNSIKIYKNRAVDLIYYGVEDSLVSETDINVLKIPDWMSFEDNQFLGTINERDCRRLVFDTVNTKIIFNSTDQFQIIKKFDIDLVSSSINLKPSLIISEKKVYSNIKYTSFITSNNGDIFFGDSLQFEVFNKPSWLDILYSSDTLFLSGIPTSSNEIDKLVVKAVDSKGESSLKTFILEKIFLSNNLFSAFPNPVSDECNFVSNLKYDSFIDVFVYGLNGLLIDNPYNNYYCPKNGHFVCSFKGYDPGFYLVKIVVKNDFEKDFSKTVKIIKN